VDALARGDGAAATASFDATMKAALPAEKLGAVWAQIVAQAGAFGGVEGAKLTQAGAHRTVLLTCRFAAAPLVAKVVFDADGKVAGLFFVPPEAVATAPWAPPPYASPDRFTEREVSVGTAPALPGTLTLPKGAGPFPAVVLVHGSGPNDADESIGGAKVFKDLAWGLASRGVAVLRYVKRTRHSPGGVVGVKEEVIDGAKAAVELLRATPEVDKKRVVVVGHSQGAEQAPRIAAENAAAVAGIVLMAAPSRPLQDVVVDQFAYFAKLDPQNPALAKKVEEARAFKAQLDDPKLAPDADVVFPGAGGLKGAYFLSMRGYKPTEVAGKLHIPILVLQGDRDYQVTAPDLDGWKAAVGKKANVTIKQYAALNHLFIAGTGTPSPAEYEKPGHVDEQVIRDIAEWVGRLPAH
jgi:dienelactone hydrolase